MTSPKPGASQANLDTLSHGVAGSVAGALATIILYPLDYIKISLQMEDERAGTKGKGIVGILKRIFEKGQFSEIYQGITPDVLDDLISKGVYFYCYENVKSKWNVKTNDLIGYTKAATVASLITTLISNPFKVINTKMILHEKAEEEESYDKPKEDKGYGTVKCIKEIYAQDGWTGFFRGLGPSLILIINPIIQYVVYEFLKNKIKDIKSYHGLMIFIVGGVSKAIATICTYPYQVIRTHTHISKTEKNFVNLVLGIYRNNGLKGYFKGLGMKIFQSVVNSALMLVIYEKLFLIIRKELVGRLLK